MNWRIARTCDGGACAEVGQDETVIAVRDTADRGGPVLTFPAAAWRVFAGGLRDGRGGENRVFTDGS